MTFEKHSTQSSSDGRNLSKKSRIDQPFPSIPAQNDVSEPKAFTPDQKSASADFSHIKNKGIAAWFREPSTGNEIAKPLMGVLIQQDIAYKGLEGTFLLRRGGALLRASDKSILAIQPDYFHARFIRCFGDGTEICRLSESQMDQAVALSKSNTQMRKRIRQLSTVTVWQSIIRFWSNAKSARQIRSWNDEIQAHIRDLTLRSKVGPA